MGSGWSQTSYCHDEDFNLTRIGPAASSSESTDSSDSSSDASSTIVTISEKKSKNMDTGKNENVLKEKPNMELFVEREHLPPMSAEMAMLERIRKATAARDEKERQIRAVTDLLTSLKSQFYQINYDLVAANQQYTSIYGKNAIEHHTQKYSNESFA